MVATYAAVTALLTAAKSRQELIAAAQSIQHVGCLNQRERLAGVVRRRLEEFSKRKPH